MRKNMRRALEAFEQRKPGKGDSKKTCWTDGDTLFSYAMPIAKWTFAETVAERDVSGESIPQLWISDESSTATTNAQIRAIALFFGTCREHDECIQSLKHGQECWDRKYPRSRAAMSCAAKVSS